MLTFEQRVLCGNLLQRFGSRLEPDPEPTREFGPVANTSRGGANNARCGAEHHPKHWVCLSGWIGWKKHIQYISAMPEMFSNDEGVEFWPWIAEAIELALWGPSLTPDSMQMWLFVSGTWELTIFSSLGCSWQVARLWTIHVMSVKSEWGIKDSIVCYRWSMLRM